MTRSSAAEWASATTRASKTGTSTSASPWITISGRGASDSAQRDRAHAAQLGAPLVEVAGEVRVVDDRGPPGELQQPPRLVGPVVEVGGRGERDARPRIVRVAGCGADGQRAAPAETRQPHVRPRRAGGAARPPRRRRRASQPPSENSPSEGRQPRPRTPARPTRATRPAGRPAPAGSTSPRRRRRRRRGNRGTARAPAGAGAPPPGTARWPAELELAGGEPDVHRTEPAFSAAPLTLPQPVAAVAPPRPGCRDRSRGTSPRRAARRCRWRSASCQRVDVVHHLGALVAEVAVVLEADRSFHAALILAATGARGTPDATVGRPGASPPNSTG